MNTKISDVTVGQLVSATYKLVVIYMIIQIIGLALGNDFSIERYKICKEREGKWVQVNANYFHCDTEK